MKKPKRIIAALLITVAAATMAACHTLTQGEVYDKKHIPAHYEETVKYKKIWTGKSFTRIPYSEFEYYPEKFYIYIRKETEKGEFEKDCYTVGKERYDSIKIGYEVNFEQE